MQSWEDSNDLDHYQNERRIEADSANLSAKRVSVHTDRLTSVRINQHMATSSWLSQEGVEECRQTATAGGSFR